MNYRLQLSPTDMRTIIRWNMGECSTILLRGRLRQEGV